MIGCAANDFCAVVGKAHGKEAELLRFGGKVELHVDAV